MSSPSQSPLFGPRASPLLGPQHAGQPQGHPFLTPPSSPQRGRSAPSSAVCQKAQGQGRTVSRSLHGTPKKIKDAVTALQLLQMTSELGDSDAVQTNNAVARRCGLGELLSPPQDGALQAQGGFLGSVVSVDECRNIAQRALSLPQGSPQRSPQGSPLGQSTHG